MVKTLNIYSASEDYKQEHGYKHELVIRANGEIFAMHSLVSLAVNNKPTPRIVPLEYDSRFKRDIPTFKD